MVDHVRHKSILNLIGKNLDKLLQTDVVFMNIAKAFNAVDQSKVLQIMQEFGFPGCVLIWFENDLCGRSSESLPITSGVPKGSSPIPFFLFLHLPDYLYDLPNRLSSSTGVGLFADGKWV